jgi:hypothetical protein
VVVLDVLLVLAVVMAIVMVVMVSVIIMMIIVFSDPPHFCFLSVHIISCSRPECSATSYPHLFCISTLKPWRQHKKKYFPSTYCL